MHQSAYRPHIGDWELAGTTVKFTLHA